MLLGGLWHGASWLFVIWGAYQGALLIGHRLLEPIFEKLKRFTGIFHAGVRYAFKMVIMFQLVCVGWIIFRAQSVSQVKDMTLSLLHWRGTADFSLLVPLLQFAGPLVAYEFIQYAYSRDEWAQIRKVPGWLRGVAYAVLFYLFAFYGASAESFIYFQF
jgi:D-alanyl-lipoteichoic acid acyltransferase DltB (MBOAT superfamily)